MHVGSKAAMVVLAARHPLRFPALRLRPLTQRTPAVALAELGIDTTPFADDYQRAVRDLFPRLADRAAPLQPAIAAKLGQPELESHRSKELVYLAIRATRPGRVVETGTYSGGLSTFMLRALEENGEGHLVSCDVPARAPIPKAIDEPLPAGEDPGWLIPEQLRDRLSIVLGDARETLPLVLAGGCDLFVHDSLHTTRHMLFEYGEAWAVLPPGGLLISDDVFMTPAWWSFTRARRLEFMHIGNVGITRKPVGNAKAPRPFPVGREGAGRGARDAGRVG